MNSESRVKKRAFVLVAPFTFELFLLFFEPLFGKEKDIPMRVFQQAWEVAIIGARLLPSDLSFVVPAGRQIFHPLNPTE